MQLTLAVQLVRIESTNRELMREKIGEFICQYLEEAGVKPENPSRHRGGLMCGRF